jgi:cobalt/nickel transport protein
MKKILVSSIATAAIATGALAHFQMLYTPESALEGPATVELRHVFNHPFADEHTMDIAGIESFVAINKGKEKNMLDSLKPIEFKGNENSGKAFASTYKAQRMGDHVLIVTPKPYFEKNEDAYIQQITKTIINVAGAPSDWDTNFELKAEIVPLTKPYAIWAGGTFTGIVMSEGKPVPFAEIEVEYLNHDVDLKANAMGKSHVSAPQDSFVTMGIKANKDGEFTFGIPKAGWWGFAALGVGPDSEYEGKELSQDAVIWVQAKDMK